MRSACVAAVLASFVVNVVGQPAPPPPPPDPILLLSQQIYAVNDTAYAAAQLRSTGGYGLPAGYAAANAGGYFNNNVEALGPTGSLGSVVAGNPHVYSILNQLSAFSSDSTVTGTYEFYYVVQTGSDTMGTSLDTSGSNFNHW